MGSIQALRSWALASRANEDTDLQTSGFLSGVSKTLGNQIVGIIDQLQNVIEARTKTYNSLVSSINKAIDARGGVAEKAIKGTFQALNFIKTTAASLIGQSRTPTLIPTLIPIIGGLAQTYLTKQSLISSVASAVYDYEKMMSQLGYLQSTTTYQDANGATVDVRTSNLNSGAVKFLDMRNSMMPKYQLFDDFADGQNSVYVPYTYKGSIGSLRRV